VRADAGRCAWCAARARILGVEPGAAAAEIATCANKCVFCFIHQLPRGMRRSLYVKDDDFRLSFLHGNYITLSDLDEAALARIIEQRLSPLYVSVHATDPDLRWELLGKPRHSAEILPRLERLAKAGIRMHAQIVLCPGLNDAEHLERTVHELSPLHPQIATTAIVPVGLTRHRERLPQLRTLRDDEAQALVATVETWQGRFLPALGSRFVFLGDEVYLQAGHPLPAAAAYEGFLVAEDGIGLVRRFEDDLARATARPRAEANGRRVTVVSGTLYGPRLAARLASLAPRARCRQRPQPFLRRHRGGGGPADRAGHPAPSGGRRGSRRGRPGPGGGAARRRGRVPRRPHARGSLAVAGRRAGRDGRAQRARAGPGAPCRVIP
jgi:putative radical SAM enzyme (TIGR03279 family)